MSETFTVYVCPDCGSRALNQGDDCLHSQGEDEHLRSVRRRPVEATWTASVQAEPPERGGAHPPKQGSGGAPQLDERRFIVLESIPYEGLGLVDEPTVVHPTRDAAVEYAKQHGLISPKGRRNDAEIIEVLAASPGAGELDLTDDEIRALAESAERGADFLDIQGVHALTGVAKLRARLDRKNDER